MSKIGSDTTWANSRAERASWFTDAELDGLVDALARRIASFDKQAIADTKHLVNVASLPTDADIAPEWDAFLASVQRPAAQVRIKALMDRVFHKPGDAEDRLGFHIGQLGRYAPVSPTS
jgi:hypothetical protein